MAVNRVAAGQADTYSEGRKWEGRKCEVRKCEGRKWEGRKWEGRNVRFSLIHVDGVRAVQRAQETQALGNCE
jgi:hypothetical protein